MAHMPRVLPIAALVSMPWRSWCGSIWRTICWFHAHVGSMRWAAFHNLGLTRLGQPPAIADTVAGRRLVRPGGALVAAPSPCGLAHDTPSRVHGHPSGHSTVMYPASPERALPSSGLSGDIKVPIHISRASVRNIRQFQKRIRGSSPRRRPTDIPYASRTRPQSWPTPVSERRCTPFQNDRAVYTYTGMRKFVIEI